jgi:hypothetical protein
MLAEFLLRWCFPVYGVVLGPHPRYLHTLLPGTRALAIDDSNPGWHFYKVRINSDGHRGPDESTTTAGPRIVVYGDSFIDARYAPEEATYTTRLERRLEAASVPRTSVINAGVAGYGPDQEILRLEDDLLRNRPDLVVVAVFAGNDFGDLLRNKLFRPGPDGSALEANHVLGAQALRPFRDARPLHLQRAFLSLERHLHGMRVQMAAGSAADSSSALILRTLEDRRVEYQSFVVQNDPIIRNLLGDGFDLDVSLHPSEIESRFKRRLMAAVLQRLLETTRHSGVSLLFLFIPSPIDVSDGWPLAIDRATYPEYRPSAATDFLQSEADRLGVPCVNLYEAFRASGGRSLFRPQMDRHWNAAGMDLAARLTAEAIQSKGLLASGAVPANPVAK